MNPNKLDPESMKLWEEIKQLEGQKDCCKLIKEQREAGMTHINFYFMMFCIGKIKIDYCPGCGRKIE